MLRKPQIKRGNLMLRILFISKRFLTTGDLFVSQQKNSVSRYFTGILDLRDIIKVRMPHLVTMCSQRRQGLIVVGLLIFVKCVKCSKHLASIPVLQRGPRCCSSLLQQLQMCQRFQEFQVIQEWMRLLELLGSDWWSCQASENTQIDCTTHIGIIAR